jgi:Flp pilus assembly protein TadD
VSGGEQVLRPLFLFVLLLTSLSIFAQPAPDPEPIFKQAISQHQSGNIAAAISSYQKYLAQRPDSLIALSNLGACYAHSGRYQDAIVQYRHALNLQPGNAHIEMNLALAYYKTGQIATAATALERVHRAAPGEMQPILLLADCRLAMGENQRVIDLLAPVATRLPSDLAIAYLYGTALIRDGQPKQGQVIVDRILSRGDSAETRMLLGTSKLTAGDSPGALADLAKAVELNPDLPDLQAYYGQALLRTGDPAGATAAYQKALAANPYDFTANLQLAILYMEDEQMPQALECLHRARQVRPTDVALRYQLAAVELHDGKLDPARRDLEAIVKDAPNYTQAHVQLATVYYRLKRKEDGDRERAIVQKLNAEAQARQQQGLNIK